MTNLEAAMQWATSPNIEGFAWAKHVNALVARIHELEEENKND